MEKEMNNIYVGAFKDVLISYLAKAKNIAKELEENNNRFSVEYAKQENEKVQEKAKKYYTDAKNSINAIFLQVREYLAIANFPNVEDLTADRLLFTEDTNIKLSNSEVISFIERYKDNYMMLRIIKEWLNNKNDIEGITEFTPIGVFLNLPSDVLEIYQKFALSALNAIDTIYSGGNDVNAVIVDRIDNKVVPNKYELLVNAYADVQFAQDLFAVIGNGMCLSNYKSKRVPESAKHCFDNVVLPL